MSDRCWPFPLALPAKLLAKGAKLAGSTRMFGAMMIGNPILSHRAGSVLMLLSLRTMSHMMETFCRKAGIDMNMSQQRFFLLLQKLEGIETALAATRKEISEVAKYVDNINEFTQVLNYRLVFAGQALLLQSNQGISEKWQKEYNGGRLGVKASESADK